MKGVVYGKRIRKPSFMFCFHGLFRFFAPRSKFYYLGKEQKTPMIILSNHAGISCPFGFEMYYKRPMRLWGTYQMTKGLKSVKEYYTNIFLKQKHPHYSDFRCKFLGTVLSPFANAFYGGNQFIPTYPDARLKETMKESIETLEKGYDIVIFPEDSSKGYFDKIEKVFAGFAVLCETLYKRGTDIPVAFCYYHKKTHKAIIGEPVFYSVLRGEKFDKNELMVKALDGINTLASVPVPDKSKLLN